MEGGRELRRFEGDSGLEFDMKIHNPVAFSPDGRRVLTGSWDSTARLWDVRSGKELRQFEGSSVISVAFSPDGRRVLTGSFDATARLWDVESGKELRRFKANANGVWSVAFSPDGRLVLTGNVDGTARLWDVKTGRELRRLEGHRGAVRSVAFSPDGRRIISGSEDGTARLWNTKTGEEVCALISFRNPSPHWAVVAPDGRFDASDLDRIRGLYWLMPDDPMMPLGIEVFMRDYYEPSLLRRLAAGDALPAIGSLMERNPVQPGVRILKVLLEGSANTVLVEVENRSRDRAGETRRSGAQDLRLFRNRRLVAYRDGPLDFDPETGKATVRFSGIRYSADGEMTVEYSAYAFNADGVKSETSTRSYGNHHRRRRGVPYIVSVGIDAFDFPSRNLRYAAEDARAMASSLGDRLRDSGSFLHVAAPTVLTSEKTQKGATKGEIEASLRKLAKQAGPEDTVIITVSTHGHAEDGEFYLLPSDAGTGPGWLKSCISATELSSWLRDLDAGEIVMILDTCHAGASTGKAFKPAPLGNRGLGQLAYNKRMRLLLASQAAEFALEHSKLRHGLLTYALVREALEGERGDFRPADGKTTLREWLAYAEQRVPDLAREIAEGRVHAVGAKGLSLPRKPVRIAQRPVLWDFTGEDGVVLRERR